MKGFYDFTVDFEKFVLEFYEAVPGEIRKAVPEEILALKDRKNRLQEKLGKDLGDGVSC